MVKRQFRVILFCMFCGVLSATTCFAAKQSPTQANSQSETEAISSLLKKQVSDWNRGDIPAFMGGYWDSKYTEFVNGSGIFQGWEAVLQRYLHSYPNRAAMGHLTFSGLEIHLLCPDSAYVVGEYRLDRQKDTLRGVFTLIFKKFPEGWRIVNDHTTAFQKAK
jgi:ketosteroid isomerase-like protein